MKRTNFKDFLGNPQTCIEREVGDADEAIYSEIKYPDRLFLADFMRYATLKSAKNTTLRKYLIYSIVNYDDLRYTSVLLERRNQA